MLRSLLGIILGLLVMFGVMFLGLTAAWFILGAEGSLSAGSFAVSGSWTAITFVVVALAGITAGAVCAKIAPEPNPSRVLAGIVLLLLLLASVKSFREAPQARTGAVGMFAAMDRAYTPPAAALITAFVGGAAVVAGGMVARRKR